MVNCMWYQDIAAAAYAVGHPTLPRPQPRRSGVGTVLGEELFRVTLFAVFLVQVRYAHTAIGFRPFPRPLPQVLR